MLFFEHNSLFPLRSIFASALKGLFMKLFPAILLAVFAFISVGAQTPSVAPTPAVSPTLADHPDDYKPGEEIRISLKFNKPIPENSSVTVFFGSANQSFSAQATDIKGDRAEALVKTTIPDSAIAGEWRVNAVVVVANGSGQATQSVDLKDQIRFVVRGHKVEFPTTVTGSLIPNR